MLLLLATRRSPRSLLRCGTTASCMSLQGCACHAQMHKTLTPTIPCNAGASQSHSGCTVPGQAGSGASLLSVTFHRLRWTVSIQPHTCVNGSRPNELPALCRTLSLMQCCILKVLHLRGWSDIAHHKHGFGFSQLLPLRVLGDRSKCQDFLLVSLSIQCCLAVLQLAELVKGKAGEVAVYPTDMSDSAAIDELAKKVHPTSKSHICFSPSACSPCCSPTERSHYYRRHCPACLRLHAIFQSGRPRACWSAVSDILAALVVPTPVRRMVINDAPSCLDCNLARCLSSGSGAGEAWRRGHPGQQCRHPRRQWR